MGTPISILSTSLLEYLVAVCETFPDCLIFLARDEFRSVFSSLMQILYSLSTLFVVLRYSRALTLNEVNGSLNCSVICFFFH